MNHVTWIVLAVLIWAGGLFVFGRHVAHLDEPTQVSADAIVVLTGGTARVTTGVQLLENNSAPKVFITGVHEAVLFQHLIRAKSLQGKIDLGYKARNTNENFTETRDWLLGRDIKSIILVTSNYHMPRAMQLFQHLHGLKVIPYPVTNEHVNWKNWYADWDSFSLIFSEYHKFLATWIGG